MTKRGLVLLLGALICVLPASALAAPSGAGRPNCQAGKVASQVRVQVRRDGRRVWVQRWRCVAVTPSTTQTTSTLTQNQTAASATVCSLASTGCYDLVSAVLHYPISALGLALGTP